MTAVVEKSLKTEDKCKLLHDEFGQHGTEKELE